MARSYSLATIKTLFGEASSCAHPDCQEPLIFWDRGLATAVAEIAHIRSELPAGPRHDPAYRGDINGPDNLLLLCGKHHRAVDRHEGAYSVAELENWKQAQRATAGAGTQLSDADLRAYRTLTAEEHRAIADVARLAQRVIAECEAGRHAVEQVRREAEAAQLASANSFGPVFVTDEHGRQRRLQAREISLPGVELQKWRNKEREVAETHRQRATAASRLLEEELAVLLMYAPDLRRATAYLSRTAATAPRYIEHSEPSLEQAIDALSGAITQLWRAANGVTPDDE